MPTKLENWTEYLPVGDMRCHRQTGQECLQNKSTCKCSQYSFYQYALLCVETDLPVTGPRHEHINILQKSIYIC